VRLSRLLSKTLRQPPADAEDAATQLLVRAGYLRRAGPGSSTLLPLGCQVLARVEAIMREEAGRSGCQEIRAPLLVPAEHVGPDGAGHLLWGADRATEHALSPADPEALVRAVESEIGSYRDLPVLVHQIRTVFRDEERPRLGMLCARELVAHEAAAIDADEVGMRRSYDEVLSAYRRIAARLGLVVVGAEAAPAVAGARAHRLVVQHPHGDRAVARCDGCGYAATLDAATAGAGGAVDPEGSLDPEDLVEHRTPACTGIDELVAWFAHRGLRAPDTLKAMALAAADGSPVVALVPGDRDVRVPPGLRPFGVADFAAHPELVKGYLGPIGLSERGVRVIADHAVRRRAPWVLGANRADHHVTGAVAGQDFTVDEWQSLATVAEGDPCASCGRALRLVRGFGLAVSRELATSARGTYVDEGGRQQPAWVSHHSLGVTRAIALVAEAHHDGAGLCWPAEVAPGAVHLVAIGAARNPEVGRIADELYAALEEHGVAVLYDDRDQPPGVKFADADLIGLPWQLVVGHKGLARGVIERKDRPTGERDELPLAAVVATVVSSLGARRG